MKHRCFFHQAPVDCECAQACLRHNKPLPTCFTCDKPTMGVSSPGVRECDACFAARREAKSFGTKRSQSVTPKREAVSFDVV